VSVVVKIQTAIVTALRREIYIHDTLSALAGSGYSEDGGPLPIRIVVGSPEASYLDAYGSMSGKYTIERLDSGEAKRASYGDLRGTRKCSFTHTLAMAEHKIPPDVDAVLILEDDILFVKAWKDTE
jgi:hypothetical protein